MAIIPGYSAAQQEDFAAHYRELVLPQLMRLVAAWAVWVGDGRAPYCEAAGSIMVEAVRLGAAFLADEDLASLEDYLLTALASDALAAEFAQENAR